MVSVPAPIKKLVGDRFLLGMIGAVVLASLAPDLGRSGGLLHADRMGEVGVFLTFFFHGLALSPASLRAGMLRYKLHIAVQAFTFVVFPLIGFLVWALLGKSIPADIMLGFFYLCALPSTISSSVAMTALARGNVPAAVFNASLSSLLGFFITPLLVGLVAATQGHGFELTSAMSKIAVMLLLPFIAGQVLRPAVYRRLAAHEKRINGFDRGVILLLVLSAFSDSVKSGLWSRHGAATLGLVFIGAACILTVVLWLSTRVARLLRLSTEDEITLVFCGSKKTLASGVPMASALFGADPALGVIVLPIMFYHQLQLFVCSVIAGRYANRPERGEPRRSG